MKIFKFREWPVYIDSLAFRKHIYKQIAPNISKTEVYGLTAQLKNATNSVILNIAEGSYRASDKDFAHFLNQATTSLNEVVACLDILLDDKVVSSGIHQETLLKANNLAKQLIALRRSLIKK
jgi:four helix bundle protein